MPQPIGYWVNVRDSHPAHQTLKNLETGFGSLFEAFDLPDLCAILSYCAAESDDSGSWTLTQNREFNTQLSSCFELIDQLEPALQVALAQFLSGVISSKMNR